MKYIPARDEVRERCAHVLACRGNNYVSSRVCGSSATYLALAVAVHLEALHVAHAAEGGVQHAVTPELAHVDLGLDSGRGSRAGRFATYKVTGGMRVLATRPNDKV